MKLEGKQERHFFCKCGSEMIRLSLEEDVIEHKGKKHRRAEINFAIYLHGIVNHEYSLKERLRHVWQILKNKTPYGDFAILSIADARRMGETLIKMTKGEKDYGEGRKT